MTTTTPQFRQRAGVAIEDERLQRALDTATDNFRQARDQAADLQQTTRVGGDQDCGAGLGRLAQLFGGHGVGNFGQAQGKQAAKTAAAVGLAHFADRAADGLQQAARLLAHLQQAAHVAGIVVGGVGRRGTGRGLPAGLVG